ncbi:hypothetical protein BY996DRAFT_6413542 [Phakopsora pachyrhizi]|nr:hypothetical protein BY996DRAFT_6413542 [Phakopsora pachyrhizi]
MQCAQLVNRVATNTLLSIETMFPVKYWLHLGEFLASKRHFIQYDQFATPRDRILDGAFNSLQELNASENLIPRLLLVGTGATLVSLNVYHAKISSLGQEFFDALHPDQLCFGFISATHLSEKLIDEGQSVDKPPSIKWATSETTYLGSS